MRYSESEIVEDVLEHIRQTGGEFRDWRVGAALDAQAPFFRQHTPNEGSADSLIRREAYTTYAADEVVERLAEGFGLDQDRDAACKGGKVVFVYRPVKVAVAG